MRKLSLELPSSPCTMGNYSSVLCLRLLISAGHRRHNELNHQGFLVLKEDGPLWEVPDPRLLTPYQPVTGRGPKKGICAAKHLLPEVLQDSYCCAPVVSPRRLGSSSGLPPFGHRQPDLGDSLWGWGACLAGLLCCIPLSCVVIRWAELFWAPLPSFQCTDHDRPQHRRSWKD